MTQGKGWILVSGASRGIGRATCGQLATSGFDICCWSRSSTGLEDVERSITKMGRRVRAAQVDVGNITNVINAMQDFEQSSENLVGVVINAGAGKWNYLSRTSAEEWDTTLATNLTGAFNVLKVTAPRLSAGGIIVGVLSDSVLYPFEKRAAYSAAKSGMRSLLEVARREYRPRGIRVSLIFPSRVDTYFEGGHPNAKPGIRTDALQARDVASVISNLFLQPISVELREVHISAVTATFGPFPERSGA